jgi:hypothetical protein
VFSGTGAAPLKSEVRAFLLDCQCWLVDMHLVASNGRLTGPPSNEGSAGGFEMIFLPAMRRILPLQARNSGKVLSALILHGNFSTFRSRSSSFQLSACRFS